MFDPLYELLFLPRGGKTHEDVPSVSLAIAGDHHTLEGVYPVERRAGLSEERAAGTVHVAHDRLDEFDGQQAKP